MRFLAGLPVCAALLCAFPALAAQEAANAEKVEKPVTERDVSAVDVAATPVSDLNLRKDEIPPLLLAAQLRPYDTTGLNRCDRIAAAVGNLDAVLGEDVDMPATNQGGIKPGRVAQSVVGAFIPFRGVIRELSGANAQERKLQAAITAGIARRSFLKGYGQSRGCRYPARGAVLAAVVEPGPGRARQERERARTSAARAPGAVKFVSEPVVQAPAKR